VVQLDRKELELGQISREFSQALQSRAASLGDVRAKLKPEDCLLEIRQYRPVDFASGDGGEARWVGTLLASSGSLRIKDLGAVSSSTEWVNALSEKRPDEEKMNLATHRLYEQLLAPFAPELEGRQKLYVASDGLLYLVPFDALSDNAGRRLLETKDVRLLQTARDLLRVAPICHDQRSDGNPDSLKWSLASAKRRRSADPPD
jgi:CHAT domain